MAGDEEPRTKPLERSLTVARFFLEEGRPITITELMEALPEYRAKKVNTATKKLNFDRKVLKEEARIEIIYDEKEHSYFLPSPIFTSAERMALVTAARDVALDGLDVSADPHGIGSEVDTRSAIVAVRVPAILDELQMFVAERRVVQFHYSGKDRTVEPWRIGQWRDGWYLIAFEIDADATKTFALDRIQPVGDADEITASGPAAAFTVPEDVDWEALFSMDPNRWGSDPEIAVLIRIADAFRPLLADTFDDWRPTRREGDDIIVEITSRHYESTIMRLLSFGKHAKVLGPPAFVQEFREWLEPQAEVR